MVNASINRELRVYSLSRSGQHAILFWLLDQFAPDEIVYYNNIGYRGRQFTPDTTINRPILTKRDARVELFLLSFEGGFINSYEENMRFFSKNPDFLKKISILRDPFNLFASKIKNREKKFEEVISEYIFLANLEGDYKILYNNWFASEKYRRRILKDLNIERKTKGPFSKVPPNGTGSSFDKRKFNGRAEQMKVLDRYKQYLNDQKYLNLFRDNPELITISKDHFGFFPDDLKKALEETT